MAVALGPEDFRVDAARILGAAVAREGDDFFEALADTRVRFCLNNADIEADALSHRLRALAAGIDDPELAATLQRLAQRHGPTGTSLSQEGPALQRVNRSAIEFQHQALKRLIDAFAAGYPTVAEAYAELRAREAAGL